jgi:formate-dependent nitrite reductase membrane component NrfD
MRAQPWDFMIKDTPSRDWAEGAGVLIAVAFFCGGTAGGLYLLSLYYNNIWGMFIGWLFALGMGLFDMGHLGNKAIFWKMVLRPGSSWISRGFLFVILFIGSAGIQMALTMWAPGTPAEIFFKVVAGMTALGVATYSGFVISYVSCIKFWHSAIMPVLFIVAGLTCGTAILMVIYSITGPAQFSAIRSFSLYILPINIIIVAMHLWISTYNSSTAKNSVKAIVSGSLGWLFWPVVVVIGSVIPMVMTFLSDADSQSLLIVNALFILAGNLALRYTILRAGMYPSLLTDNTL